MTIIIIILVQTWSCQRKEKKIKDTLELSDPQCSKHASKETGFGFDWKIRLWGDRVKTKKVKIKIIAGPCGFGGGGAEIKA